MEIVRSSQVLVSKASTGLDKFWQGHIVTDGKDYFLTSSSWRELAGGGTSKVVESVPYLVTVKNVGKINETDPLEQAESEFDSMVKKQMDSKNYLPKGTKASAKKLPLPMLAQKYRDKSHKIQWPAFIQRKYDGNRMIFNGENAQTRGGKPFLDGVIKHLKFDTKGYILDGELMLPGNVPLQTTMKAVKKVCEESKTLVYCVYDIVDESLTFEDRYRTLKELLKSAPKSVVSVETVVVKSESEMQAKHEEWVLEGFEGTIIRNGSGKYAINQRSENLQKHKDFLDQEYEIVGVKSGEGLYSDCAIFRCVTEDGEEFDSNPEGTLEYKREIFRNKGSYIGKWLTVRFFSKSLSGKPLMNVGVAVRDKEEF